MHKLDEILYIVKARFQEISFDTEVRIIHNIYNHREIR